MLLASGFDFTLRNYNTFIKTAEIFGRANKNKFYEAFPEKEHNEVDRYIAAFWKNFETIPNHKQVEQRIQAGEAKVRKTEYLRRVLQTFASEFVYENLCESVEESWLSHKLLELLPKDFFGNWADLTAELEKEIDFQFDWKLVASGEERVANKSVELVEKFENWLTGKAELKEKLSKLKTILK